jgi:hypothetical protein
MDDSHTENNAKILATRARRTRSCRCCAAEPDAWVLLVPVPARVNGRDGQTDGRQGVSECVSECVEEEVCVCVCVCVRVCACGKGHCAYFAIEMERNPNE